MLTQHFFIFLPSMTHERYLQNQLTIPFAERLKKIIWVHLHVLPKLLQIFCCHRKKNTNHEPFLDILMTITLGTNLITRKMTPFFWSTLQALSICIFYCCISRPLKFPPLHFFLFCKIHIYMPKITLLSLLTLISLLYIKFANFSYIICSAPNLILIWSRSHGLYLLLTFMKSKIKWIRISHREN